MLCLVNEKRKLQNYENLLFFAMIGNLHICSGIVELLYLNYKLHNRKRMFDVVFF